MPKKGPIRKSLPHEVPSWVPDGSIYFITINCRKRGPRQLTTDQNFSAIQRAAQHYRSEHLWHISLMVIMPDHLHGLITFNTRAKSISTIVGSWKRFLAREREIEWQPSYFEHRIRNQSELIEKEDYIRLNPVRANLIDHAEAWPYIIRDD